MKLTTLDGPRVRIVKVLMHRRRGISVTEIAVLTGQSTERVQNLLSALASDDLVEFIAGDGWTITAKGKGPASRAA